jgi:hypothetical protein
MLHIPISNNKIPKSGDVSFPVYIPNEPSKKRAVAGVIALTRLENCSLDVVLSSFRGNCLGSIKQILNGCDRGKDSKVNVSIKSVPKAINFSTYLMLRP